MTIFFKSGRAITNALRANTESITSYTPHGYRNLFFPQSRYCSAAFPSVKPRATLTTLLKSVQLDEINPKTTAIVGCQHMVKSQSKQFAALHSLGFLYQNMFFLPKLYSTHPPTLKVLADKGMHLVDEGKLEALGEFDTYFNKQVEKLWQMFAKSIDNVEQIIVMDEGGYCLARIPRSIRLDPRFEGKIVGIEQTRGGLYNTRLKYLPFPVIEVASSFAKRELESPGIIDAIVRRLNDEPLIKGMTPIKTMPSIENKIVFGVIGNGAIGLAIVQWLAKNFPHHRVLVFDKNRDRFNQVVSPNNVRQPLSISSLIANSQVIFSCTGQDVTKGINVLEKVQGDTTFISCASSDREFNMLLKRIGRRSEFKKDRKPMDNVQVHHNGINITILNGGFPVNFNRDSGISLSDQDSQLTMSLMTGAVMQALTILKSQQTTSSAPTTLGYPLLIDNHRIKLDPNLQQLIAKTWLKTQKNTRFNPFVIQKFDDISVIKENSGDGISSSAISIKKDHKTATTLPRP